MALTWAPSGRVDFWMPGKNLCAVLTRSMKHFISGALEVAMREKNFVLSACVRLFMCNGTSRRSLKGPPPLGRISRGDSLMMRVPRGMSQVANMPKPFPGTELS